MSKSKVIKKFLKVAEFHEKREKHLKELNEILSKKFNDYLYIGYQHSDGWVIVFEGERNAVFSTQDLNEIYEMEISQVKEFLIKKEV